MMLLIPVATTLTTMAVACSTIKFLLSNGHDEYWSKEQRNNVEAARNAGVNLAFFSGNEVYWKTRWESNDGTEDRTLVCYKEGTMADGTLTNVACGSKCDPSLGMDRPLENGCQL